MAYKLDIGDALNKIDRRDLNYYSRLTDEEKSGYNPLAFLRFTSSAPGNKADWYLIGTNMRANLHFAALRQHPELQLKLLASCGSGQPVDHRWIAPAPRRGGSDKVSDFLRRFWRDANDQEIKILLSQFDHESFVDFAERSGLDSEEVAEVIKAYERLNGISSAKTPARKGRKPKA